MLCCHTIVVTDELQVDLQPCHYGEDQPGKIESDEATVYLELKFASESTEIARAIHGAESLAMASSQGQGDRGGANMNAADTIAAMVPSGGIQGGASQARPEQGRRITGAGREVRCRHYDGGAVGRSHLTVTHKRTPSAHQTRRAFDLAGVGDPPISR